MLGRRVASGLRPWRFVSLLPSAALQPPRPSLALCGLIAAVALAVPAAALGAPAARSGGPSAIGKLSQLSGPSGCLVDRATPRRGCTSVRALRGPAPFLGSEAIAISPDAGPEGRRDDATRRGYFPSTKQVSDVRYRWPRVGRQSRDSSTARAKRDVSARKKSARVTTPRTWPPTEIGTISTR